ncbi:MAG: glycosyltransferase family 2 protein [bacterium]|nr:glycosyltransferase family 2 protein [bacterium]
MSDAIDAGPPPLAPAQVTIVVLNWRRADDTIACLASLAAARLDGARVLVVDNGSGDGSVARIRAAAPAVPIIALAENRGYAGGNNAGIEQALADGAAAVLLLNNDTLVSPDFLAPLVEALAASPEAAAVCGAVHRHDRPELLDVAWSEVRFADRHAVQLRGVNAVPGEGFDQRRNVEIAVGCVLLLRATALRQIGLLDETYFAYHEDVEWGLRARAAGWQLFYEPYARVYHRGSASTGVGGRTADPGATDAVNLALPNAEVLRPNPVRAYLGGRNVVRLLRAYATPEERRSFVKQLARRVPLELAALALDRQGWLRLGRFDWAEAARVFFLDRHGLPRGPLAGAARRRRALRLAVLAPVDVVWGAPHAVWSAWRAGRLSEATAELRGLLDGWRDRPLPLVRLGLRPAAGEEGAQGR